MGVGEHRPLRGDEEVAAERHLQAAGERRAVDRGDDRGAHVGGRGDTTLRPKLLEVSQPVALGLLEIHAGAERRVGAGQDHDADVVVGIGPRQRVVEGADQVATQRIAGTGPVHGQHAHRAVVGDEDELFGGHSMNVAGWTSTGTTPRLPIRTRFVIKGVG